MSLPTDRLCMFVRFHFYSRSSVLLALAASAAVTHGASATLPASVDYSPQVFWASEPVRPDETVLAATGNTNAQSAVEMARLEDIAPLQPGAKGANLTWTRIEPLQASVTAMKFVIPAEWSLGVYAFRIRSSNRVSEPILLNSPKVWFIQGDRGESASPGGWIQVHGTGIALAAGQPRLALLREGEVAVILSADPGGNGYMRRFRVPANLPSGRYAVWLHNGYGGPEAWSRVKSFIDHPVDTFEVVTPVPWPSKVFDVSAQSGANDDERFARVVAQVQANGGGVIFLPPGMYTLTSSLILPSHTLLRGSGKDVSTIRWVSAPRNQRLPDAAVEALVQGIELRKGAPDRAAFSIEELTLLAPPDFSSVAIDSEFSHDFGWVRRVSIVVPNIGEYTGSSEVHPTAIYLRGRHNFEVIDSQLDASRDVYARDDVANLRVEGCTLNWRDLSFWISGRSHGFIISNNVINLRGTARENGWLAASNPNPGFAFTSFFGTLSGGPYTRDLYYGNNQSIREQQELPPSYVGFTFDGSQGIYLGAITSIDGVSMTLAGKTLKPANGSGYDWAGAVVQIVDGRGAGQWRYLQRAGPDERVVVVDRPWDVEPDSSSVVNLINLQGRVLMVNNDFAQEQTNQEYYFAMDVIKAQNTYGVRGARTINLAWIGQHYQGLAPGWHYQLLDNKIVRGTDVLLGTAVQTKMEGYAGIMGAYHVFRGNRTEPAVSSSISIAARKGHFADFVVENNLVSELNLGAKPSDPLDFDGALLRHNHAALGHNLSDNALRNGRTVLVVP